MIFMRNRIIATGFAIVLGSYGIHKFYLGRHIQGILYLVFFWTLIPAVVGFIDGIILVSMSDETFNKKYNKTVTNTV